MSANQRRCRAIIRKHSKSFSLASRLLPAEIREDAVALYAWCRGCDDAVDADNANFADKSAQVNRLSRELDDLYLGRPQSDPVLESFARVVRSRRIPIEYPRGLVAGMARDLQQHRYQTVAELMEYAYLVAGTVGLMMCHVMQVGDERALRHASHLGMAMQLTNICRDVREDWGRGRLYVPAELFPPSDRQHLSPVPGSAPPLPLQREFSAAVARLLALADRYYRSADQGMGYLPWRCAVAIGAARNIYAEIGVELARRGVDVFGPRVIVSRAAKLRLAASAAATQTRSRLGRADPLPAVRCPASLLRFSDALLL